MKMMEKMKVMVMKKKEAVQVIRGEEIAGSPASPPIGRISSIFQPVF